MSTDPETSDGADLTSPQHSRWKIDPVSLASRLALALPPVRGLGVVIELASRLFSNVNREVLTSIDGIRIAANPSIADGRRHLFAARYHDCREKEFVRSVLRPGDYAVDLGANIGLYTLLFAKLVGPAGKVTAIEAEPANAARLRKNVALNEFRHVEVIERGASDKCEILALHLSGTNLGMHSFVNNEGKGDVRVECVPLSNMIDGHPRLLKVDIELFEYRVLKRFFADGTVKPDYILMEAWDSASESRDALALCVSNNYRQVDRLGPNVVLRHEM